MEEDSSLEFSEATEYVKQQLSAMGVHNVVQKDLESYTQDFLQLLKEKEDKLAAEENNEDTDKDTDSTSLSPPLPSSAVYKTVLHDDDLSSSVINTPLLPATDVMSPTPSLSGSFERHYAIPDKPVIHLSVRNSGNRLIKRKVLRHCDLPSYSADNSLISDASSCVIDGGNGGTSINHSVAGSRLSNKPPKSFIRPTTDLPHCIKGTAIKKCDPVQRYHEYNECWKVMKPPGEQPRHGLRWHIREQLLQDGPPPMPAPPTSNKPSKYIVPTSKKRQDLRWTIRHQLAQK